MPWATQQGTIWKKKHQKNVLQTTNVDNNARNPYTLLEGRYISITTMESSMEALQKNKNRTTI
jgi:hypothetical protein